MFQEPIDVYQIKIDMKTWMIAHGLVEEEQKVRKVMTSDDVTGTRHRGGGFSSMWVKILRNVLNGVVKDKKGKMEAWTTEEDIMTFLHTISIYACTNDTSKQNGLKILLDLLNVGEL